jgi:putative zinc finger/helix-turn-helix YgiT family protein
MTAYCPSCDEDREVTVSKQRESYPVKGEPIVISANVVVCDVCGATIYDDELDEENLEEAYGIYREKHGLLAPRDLRELRAEYGLSQRGLSSLLGWSQATIARYEAGAIPSVAHNSQLIHFRGDLDYALELYHENKHKLNSLEAKRAADAFGSVNDSRSIASMLESFLSKCYAKNSALHVGNKAFDIDKLANMVVFFASGIQDLVKSKLLKLLWYADFLCYKRQGVSASGTPYVRDYYGPIPAHHDMLLAYLQEDGIVETRPYEGPYEGEYILPLVEFDKGLFSKEELDVLMAVVTRFKDSTAKEISRCSHDEDGYRATEMKQMIPYSYAESLKAIH